MMLIRINSILSPDLLAPLRTIGHGDEIAIVDGNYPALAHARRLIRLGCLTLSPVMDAVTSALPVNENHYQIVKICKNMYQKKINSFSDGRELLCACSRLPHSYFGQSTPPL